MNKLSPDAEMVRCMLTGVPVVGREPDLDRVTDRELGDLAALAWGPRSDRVRDFAVRRALVERSPVFDVDSAVAALDALDASAKEEFEAGGLLAGLWQWENAAQVVAGCVEFEEPRVKEALKALLSRGVDPEAGNIWIALLSCSDQEVPEHPDELIRAEHRLMCGLELPRDRIKMAKLCPRSTTGEDGDRSPRGADTLALLPGFLEHAEKLTTKALERVNAVHSGGVDYKADKAFSVSEAQAIRRGLRAGLDQGAQWALDAAIPLLAGVSQAPNPKVKSVPSQSASIAIAKAIAERPSAPLIIEMKAAIADIRHAGIKKKLGKFVKTAERRMFEDDDFLFGLEPDTIISKPLFRSVVRALEAMLSRTSPIDVNLWSSRILGNKSVAKAATLLVWRFGDGTSALPVKTGQNWSFIGPDGQPCSSTAETITLWHPLQPDSNSGGWRALLLKRGIHQPFNQVFRETYTDQSISNLLSPEIELRSLLGLARSEGWVLREGCLVRRIGPFRVELDLGKVYPGMCGGWRCQGMGIFSGTGREPVCFADEDPQLVSECLRAVDLLVSVSAFSLDSECSYESGSARERQSALAGMLGSSPRGDRPFVDGRYVRFGEIKISIATGRATVDGAEIELPRASKGVSVLPYPDEILHRIVVAVNEFDRR